MLSVRLFVALFFSAVACVGAAELSLNFSKMPAGQAPAGFRSALMGAGKPGDWKIIEAEGPTSFPTVTAKAEAPKQNVLAQLARDPTENRYPLLILEENELGDFTLTTWFKLVEGFVEQMAGIAFRIQDEKNYYYVRASGLYNTLAFYPVVNGEITVPIRIEIPIQKGVWHELKIVARGNQFITSLNGKEVLPASANVFSSGKIGFWTKSDSVSYFADTHIVYTPRESLAAQIAREALEKNSKLLGMRIIAWKGGKDPQVVASSRSEEMGKPATDVERDVLENSKKYFGREKDKGFIIVTLPLSDKNGDTIAAVRLEMDSFKGQTEQNAIARAMPIIKEMEGRLARSPDITGF